MTRLTAELADCPADGYWNDPRPGLVEEGKSRRSDYCCYQAHHTFDKLLLNNYEENFIIYLIRDPRDIVISGAFHFEFVRFESFFRLLKMLPKGTGIYNRLIEKIIITHQYRIKQMIKTVLFGSDNVSQWCKVSWKKHFNTYLNKKCLFIRYEDLINNPKNQCQKILDYLELERPESGIEQVIKNQSFSHKKSVFIAEGELYKAKHLRIGLINQWREGFTAKQKILFINHLKDELDKYSYPLN